MDDVQLIFLAVSLNNIRTEKVKCNGYVLTHVCSSFFRFYFNICDIFSMITSTTRITSITTNASITIYAEYFDDYDDVWRIEVMHSFFLALSLNNVRPEKKGGRMGEGAVFLGGSLASLLARCWPAVGGSGGVRDYSACIFDPFCALRTSSVF